MPSEIKSEAPKPMVPRVKERQAVGAIDHEPASSLGALEPPGTKTVKSALADPPTMAPSSDEVAEAARLLRRADHFMASVIHHLPPGASETEMASPTVPASAHPEAARELSPQQRASPPSTNPAEPGPAVVIGQLSVEVVPAPSAPPPVLPGAARTRIAFRGRSATRGYTRGNSFARFGLGQG